MIRSTCNLDTGEATASYSGTDTILRAEIKALRKLMMKDYHFLGLWLEGLEDELNERKEKEENE